MSRILTVAESEFLTLVKTKFFLISLILVPVLMGGLMFFMQYAESGADREDRRFAVVDRTGILYESVTSAAADFNAEAGEGESRTGPHFLPERVDAAGRSPDEVAVELSERVRRKELFAFVDIPPAVLEPAGGEERGEAAASADPTASPGAALAIRYHSEQTAYAALPNWLTATLEDAIVARRLANAGVDRALVDRLQERPALSEFGLVERGASGQVMAAKEVDELEQFGIPFFFLILMFMAVMTNAQHLINSIVEEKMSKISEVLLGSVSAAELLAGKLLAVVAVSLLLATVYLAGGTYAVVSMGRVDLIDFALLGWFFVFLLCASLLFGSIFLALSSACSDLKDAQSMLQPAMLLVIVAYMASFFVIRAPDSSMAVGLSFFPTVTPFAMLLRLALPPGPPLWQVVLSVVILLGTTVVVVWAAGKIFRIGLLMQGKPPNLPELLRWIRA